MTKKLPPSRNRKALVILESNLTPVQQRQQQLLNDNDAHAVAELAVQCWLDAEAYESWELVDDSLLYLSHASRVARELIKLRREFG